MTWNNKELIGYAAAFVSWVLPKIDVDEIILFGSAARQDAGKESDVDIFVNVTKNEKKAKKTLQEQLRRFYKSSLYETYVLKGIRNPLMIEVGNLEKWKLKRSVISEGIVLFGKYKSMPTNVLGYSLFYLRPIKDITKRNKVIRGLFGRKENKKSSDGLVVRCGGKQISPTTFLIPLERSSQVIHFLSSEKQEYAFFEFWSDQVH